MLGGGVPFLTDWSGKTFPEEVTRSRSEPGEVRGGRSVCGKRAACPKDGRRRAHLTHKGLKKCRTAMCPVLGGEQ